MPWVTIADSFDKDFGVDEWHGHNAFIRDGDNMFRTYFINNRGDEAMGSTWSYLDMTALGRQEKWEDSPEGYPQERTLQVVELARINYEARRPRLTRSGSKSPRLEKLRFERATRRRKDDVRVGHARPLRFLRISNT